MDYDYHYDSDSDYEDTVEVDPKWHRHIIGKNGINIRRIKSDTNTTIDIPPVSSNSSIIRIKGSSCGVTEAKKEILKIANKFVS